MGWVRVCRVAELSERSARRVEHDGHVVCVSLADGQPHAIDDRCPHREAALSGGLVRDGVVTCPGHFRRFDLRTGRCIGQPGEGVRTYECAVVDGWVQVDLGTASPRRSMREILLAHARGDDRGPGRTTLLPVLAGGAFGLGLGPPFHETGCPGVERPEGCH